MLLLHECKIYDDRPILESMNLLVATPLLITETQFCDIISYCCESESNSISMSSGIKNRDKLLHPTDTVGRNYLSLSFIYFGDDIALLLFKSEWNFEIVVQNL